MKTRQKILSGCLIVVVCGFLSAGINGWQVYERAKSEGLPIQHASVLNDLLAFWLIGISSGALVVASWMLASYVGKRKMAHRNSGQQ